MDRLNKWWIVPFIVLCFIGGSLVALILTSRSRVSSSDLFQRIVIRPIPASVRIIGADVCHESSFRERLTGWRQHDYLLRFDINESDLSEILASAPFTQAGYVEYRQGVLHFGWEERTSENFTVRTGGNVKLYGAREEEPPWFDLPQWKDTRAWIVQEEVESSWYKARLLLYNEQLNQACFVEHEVAGQWGGRLSVRKPRSEDIMEAKQLKREADERMPDWIREKREGANQKEEELQRRTREWVAQIEEARKHGHSEANIPLLP